MASHRNNRKNKIEIHTREWIAGNKHWYFKKKMAYK